MNDLPTPEQLRRMFLTPGKDEDTTYQTGRDLLEYLSGEVDMQETANLRLEAARLESIVSEIFARIKMPEVWDKKLALLLEEIEQLVYAAFAEFEIDLSGFINVHGTFDIVSDRIAQTANQIELTDEDRAHSLIKGIVAYWAQIDQDNGEYRVGLILDNLVLYVDGQSKQYGDTETHQYVVPIDSSLGSKLSRTVSGIDASGPDQTS